MDDEKGSIVFVTFFTSFVITFCKDGGGLQGVIRILKP